MRLFRLLLLSSFVLASSRSVAQTYVGISLNFGDRQHYQPNSDGFGTALAPSGSIFINRKKNVHEKLVLQYGATAGIAAYSIKVLTADTLSTGSSDSPFPEYSTLFVSAEVLVGPRFVIAEKEFVAGVGGGVTVYASFAPVSHYSVAIGEPTTNQVWYVFDGRMNAPANTFSPFWKIATSYNITDQFTFGAEFVYHFLAFAQGEYEFYHTAAPMFGTIQAYQREFRFSVSYKMGSDF